jgi:hypothetical protein
MEVIMKLNEQVKSLKVENEALKDGLHLLQVYLQSSKFDMDTTVQAKDVLHRLSEIVSVALEAKENHAD